MRPPRPAAARSSRSRPSSVRRSGRPTTSADRSSPAPRHPPRQASTPDGPARAVNSTSTSTRRDRRRSRAGRTAIATTIGRMMQPPTRMVTYPTSQSSTSCELDRAPSRRRFFLRGCGRCLLGGGLPRCLRLHVVVVVVGVVTAPDVDEEVDLGRAAGRQRRAAKPASAATLHGSALPPALRTSLTSSSTSSRTFRVSFSIWMGTTRRSKQRA